MAADLLDDIISDMNRGAEFLTQTIKECSEETRIRVSVIALKKDRYLALKELGDRTYRLLQDNNRDDIASDVTVLSIIKKLNAIENKISSLENELNHKSF